MDANPYEHPEGGIEPQPPRGLAVASRLLWFALGFVVSWGVWTAIERFRARPRDMTQAMPAEMRELIGPSEMSELEWMKDAVGRQAGRWQVFSAADRENASAAIVPLPPGRFPQVMLQDDDADGQIDAITVTDAGQRIFGIDVTNGRFTSYNYSTGLLGDDSVTFQDGDMDGQFDYRFGPGRRSEILVRGQWRQYVQDGDTRYVDLDGTRMALRQVDGVWRPVDDPPAN